EALCRGVGRRWCAGASASGPRGSDGESLHKRHVVPRGQRALAEDAPHRRRGGAHTDEDPVASLEAGPTEGLFVATDHAATLERLAASPRLDRSAVRALLVRPEPAQDERALVGAARAVDVP